MHKIRLANKRNYPQKKQNWKNCIIKSYGFYEMSENKQKELILTIKLKITTKGKFIINIS